MRPIARLVVLAAALALPAPAQQLVRSVPGPAANDLFGKACITIADQNGDGFKDLLAGAPGFNSQRGAIYCLSGAYLASGVDASLVAGAEVFAQYWSRDPSCASHTGLSNAVRFVINP
jgi:hypothetical protein